MSTQQELIEDPEDLYLQELYAKQISDSVMVFERQLPSNMGFEIYASFCEFLDNERSTGNAISDIYQAAYVCFKEIVNPSIKSGEFKKGDCKVLFSRESGAEDFTEVYYKNLPLCTISKQGENFVIKPSTTDVRNDLQKVKAAIDDATGCNSRVRA